MNLVDLKITKILSEPFFEYNKWCVIVEVECETRHSKTWIMEETKEKVLEIAQVGNIIQG